MKIDGYDATAALLKTLGHPGRLQIVKILREGEACVCHLEAVLGQRQAYISQQLMRLREDGLVVDRRDGMNVFYSLANDQLGPLLDTAVNAAIAVAAQTGDDLSFAYLKPATLDCTCPICQAKNSQFVQTSDVSMG
ncbi:MAG: helix-turn-helix transcriptional regulator [Anaerolineales bacterium]|nr:helix-turn-helix transcriptional regulator [Anaerolineales bacterium]